MLPLARQRNDGFRCCLWSVGIIPAWSAGAKRTTGTIRAVKARRGAIGALVAVSLLGVACSDDDDGAPTTTAPQTNLSARGDATFGGALTATMSFELQYPVSVTSCASLVAAPTYVVPLPGLVDGATLAWRAATAHLDGAGTYPLADLGTVEVTVVREGAEPVVYTTGPGTTAELQLDAEAGGTFTFAGLLDASGVELHGSSTWTCGPGA